MKASILISVVLLISFSLLTGCQNRAPSLRMLDRRADYEDIDHPERSKSAQVPNLKEAGTEGFRNGPIPVRTRPKVAAIWIHPHEMASHDYFWGGWMSVVIEPDRWALEKPGAMPKASGFVSAPEAGATTGKVRVPEAKAVLKAFNKQEEK